MMLEAFFPSPATKAVLAALDALEFNAAPDVVREVKEAARAKIKADPARTKFTLDSKKNPSAVALLTVMDAAGSEIATGNHHTYRGILSMRGDELRRVFNSAVRGLVDCQGLTEDDASYAMERLAEAIKAAG